MRFRTLDELAALGLLERKPPDPAQVGRWLDRSRSDLALARDVLARLDRDRSMAVAYEASYRACAGLLVLAGHRVTSQPGHHRAAIEGAGALLGPPARPLLRRLDAARRFRNETLYGDAHRPPRASCASSSTTWHPSSTGSPMGCLRRVGGRADGARTRGPLAPSGGHRPRRLGRPRPARPAAAGDDRRSPSRQPGASILPRST